MGVVEAFTVRSERKTPQEPARERIRKALAVFYFEQLERRCPLSPLLHFIQEQSSVWGHSERFYGCIFAHLPRERIQQKLIVAFGSFPHENAWLFLVGKSLAEEVPVSSLLKRVIGFDSKEFADASTYQFPAWNDIQVPACVLRLFSDPCACMGGVLIFEPAVGVFDGDAVQDIRDHLDAGMRRSLNQIVHDRLRCESSRASRSIRRVRLRR